MNLYSIKSYLHHRLYVNLYFKDEISILIKFLEVSLLYTRIFFSVKNVKPVFCKMYYFIEYNVTLLKRGYLP